MNYQTRLSIRRNAFAKLILLALTILTTIGVTSANCSATDIGRTTWIKGPTYSASASWNGSDDTGWVPWQLKPGWVVIDYKDQRNSQYGKANLNVSYVNAGGRYASASRTAAALDTAIKAAAQKGLTRYAAELNSKKRRYTSVMNRMASSHNTISIRATDSGSGNFFDQKGASISGHLQLKVIYVGTPQRIHNEVQFALKKINQQVGNHNHNTPTSSLSGTYDSNWGTVTIQQNGNRVTGQNIYSNGGRGTFRGTIRGRKLLLQWNSANDQGTAELEIQPNSSQLIGNWRSQVTGRVQRWSMAKRFQFSS